MLNQPFVKETDQKKIYKDNEFATTKYFINLNTSKTVYKIALIFSVLLISCAIDLLLSLCALLL